MTNIFNRPSKPNGPIATRHVYDRMKSLQVGEAFTVEWKQWRAATSPKDSIGKSRRYRDHFNVEELDGGKGWRISRVR
jgi:hypothetical protein